MTNIWPAGHDDRHIRAASPDHLANGGLRKLAVGLMGTIYFAPEPVDKLPMLLRTWKPATFSKAFLANVVELGYVTFKLLDLRTKCDDLPSDKETVLCIAAATDFDLFAYIKRLATHEIVATHRQLLSCYAANAPAANKHCLAFFRRLCSTQLPADDADDHLDFTNTETLATKSSATFEPMLFNLPVLSLCEAVLRDPLVHSSDTRDTFAEIKAFAETISRHFGRLASANHVLYAEALFQQPSLQRLAFCRTVHAHYTDPQVIAALHAPTTLPVDKGEGGGDEGPVAAPRTRASLSAVKRKVADDESDQGAAEDSDSGRAGGGAALSGAFAGAEGAEESSDENEFDVDAQVTAAPKGAATRKKARTNGRRKASGAKSWTAPEDALLRRLYPQYSGSNSVIETIREALNEEAGKDRDCKAIRARLKKLKLVGAHNELESGDLEGEGEDSGEDNGDEDADEDADEVKEDEDKACAVDEDPGPKSDDRFVREPEDADLVPQERDAPSLEVDAPVADTRKREAEGAPPALKRRLKSKKAAAAVTEAAQVGGLVDSDDE